MIGIGDFRWTSGRDDGFGGRDGDTGGRGDFVIGEYDKASPSIDFFLRSFADLTGTAGIFFDLLDVGDSF